MFECKRDIKSSNGLENRFERVYSFIWFLLIFICSYIDDEMASIRERKYWKLAVKSDVICFIFIFKVNFGCNKFCIRFIYYIFVCVINIYLTIEKYFTEYVIMKSS